jgi:hypothetical protein
MPHLGKLLRLRLRSDLPTVKNFYVFDSVLKSDDVFLFFYVEGFLLLRPGRHDSLIILGIKNFRISEVDIEEMIGVIGV